MALFKSISSKLGLDRIGIRTRVLVLYYLVIVTSVSVVGYYGYINASNSIREEAAEDVHDITDKAANDIDTFLQTIPKDLQFISQSPALKQYLYWKYLGVKRKANFWHFRTMDNFQSFLMSTNFYYQLQFLDINGEEKIKLSHDRETGRVSFQSSDEMQDELTKPYFYETIKLKQNEFYVSKFNILREDTQIRKASIPVIDFATPVIGDNKVTYGVIVLSVYAESFMSIIQVIEGRSDIYYHLISPDGRCFYHEYIRNDQLHLFGSEANFQENFPSAYNELKNKSAGIIAERGQVFSFTRIYPNSQDKKNYWMLIGQIDQNKAMAKLNQFIYIFGAIFAIVLGLAFIGSRYTVNEFISPLRRVTLQLQRLAKGEIVKEPIHYKAEDEILQILESSYGLTEAMDALTRQADLIASGDYTQSVPVLSENDRLGSAINNMTHRLCQIEEENRRQNWLKDGLNQLSQLLSGDMTPQELAERSISFLARYVDAGHGVFYVYNKENDKTLELIGAYMFTERDLLSNRYNLGQGAVGQAALEKKPILLRNITKEQTSITTGIICAAPMNTFTYPLLFENKLYGVVELAFLMTVDDNTRTFLIESGSLIAAYLYSAIQKEQIKKLLEVAETAKKQAEQQSRKLQQVNTQMEEQQQKLQQQTEELQQTNTMMEQQQQQLQQQAEELRVTNSEIEQQKQQVQQQADELQKKNKELIKTQEELTQKAKQLELSNQYKSEFLANMSHELRTPLNSIIVLSKMMEKNEYGSLGHEDVKRANVIYQAGLELLRLISDILDLTKVEAGKMEVQIENVSTENIILDIQNLFNQTAIDKGLKFEVDDRFKSTIRTDRNKLSQILRNLLSNAFKYTKKGTVSFVVQKNQGSDLPVEIIVSDTGIGIPEDKQDLIFEAFQQIDGSISREYGGTGLGLSITKKFTELLGGRVEVRSKPGEGSAFSILLPEALEDRPSMISTHAVNRTPSDSKVIIPPDAEDNNVTVHDNRDTVMPSDTTILVIDDDLSFCNFIAYINREHGFKTLIALTASDGIELVRHYPVSGILLDLTLPDMDGTEVLKLIKSTRELRHIPVYIISARDRKPGIKDIEGYLQKPVTIEQVERAEEVIINAANKPVKSIVVLEGKTLKKEMIAELLKGQSIFVHSARSIEEVKTINTVFDLVIVDYDQGGGKDVDICQTISTIMPDVPVIVYSSTNIDREEEARLRQYTDSIIVQADFASQRLSKGINRFLQDISVKKDLPAKTSRPALIKGTDLLKGHRILVVDDDARNLFVITSALEQNGAKVIQAISAKKIMEKLKTDDVSMIFMDIMMPEMSGYEAIKMIRADKRLKKIPIAALTAKALKGDRQKCLTVGANDYLSKPVDYEVLINTAVRWSKKQV